MYKNSLSELMDAIQKANGVAITKEIAGKDHRIEKTGQFMRMARPIAKDAMCFVCASEAIPNMELVGDLLKLPYNVCWFEFVWDSGVLHDCAFCYEVESGFDIALFTKQPASKFVFAGLHNVQPRADGMVQIQGRIGNAAEDKTSAFISAILKYLQALNCCNITRTEHKPKPSQQSVRRAIGRQPLFSTWTLEIDLDRTERELPGESCGGHTSKRLHLCRGHARQHKPGQWCWVRAHVRGDKSLGMIHKDYASH